MTEHADVFAALMAPFDPDEVKLRKQAGRDLHYITARTAMNRLDEVLGPENWWDEYTADEHSVLCRLTIRLADGQVITKADAGGYAGMADPGDDDKSGFSDAFKRAAVKFGVGRYLYRDGLPRFAREALRGRDDRPAAPPEPRRDDRPAPPREPRQQGGGNGNVNGQYGDPRTGRALFAWVKGKDDEDPDSNLLRHMNAWGKRQDFPFKMVEWDGAQVIQGFQEAQRKLRAIESMRHASAEATRDGDDQWEDGRE